MASQFDDSDFIDRDYQSSQAPHSATPGQGSGALSFRPPSRQELDTRVSEAQHKLAQLKRAQEELERERSALEEARRRRLELQTGRAEMLEGLTRGVTLIEQAEFAARRDAEQLARTLSGLREALGNVQSFQEESWTQENWNSELTKALAGIENARMEWNQARLKWPILNGTPSAEAAQPSASPAELGAWKDSSFWGLCRIGLALTWPVAVVTLLGAILLVVFRR